MSPSVEYIKYKRIVDNRIFYMATILKECEGHMGGEWQEKEEYLCKSNKTLIKPLPWVNNFNERFERCT